MTGNGQAQRMRAVVCGARFGQVYLEAFQRPDVPFELAGILAQGSARARACARHYGVELFTDPAQLPDDVGVGCVVIRSGLLGGRGVDIAKALMARGMHVLQEHPLHHDELAECLRAARRHRVVYHLNSFYVHVEPVRRFLGAARELLRRQAVCYVDAACGFQLAYSLLDILGQALGRVRPWTFAPAAGTATLPEYGELDVPFRSLDGVFAGVPLSLRVQNQLDPADPDNYAHLMHRVTIGTEGGNLTLVASHGPTVWSPRPEFPRAVGDPGAPPHFEAAAPGLDPPSATVLGPAQAPGYRTIFGSLWPGGVAHALQELHQAVTGGDDPLRRGQYHLMLCQLWQDLTARLGPPELLRATPPRLLTIDDVQALAGAGEAAVGAR